MHLPACIYIYTYTRDKVLRAILYVCVYIVCMNMRAAWTALRTPLFGQSTIDALIVNFRQHYSDTRCSTGILQFNVSCSRQYIPLNNLHTDVLEFVLE